MPVGSLLTAKDNASTVQALLLATITFPDGAVLRLSSHDLTGGASYGGNEYHPYIVNKQIAATQALSEHGIDIPASVTLRLADAGFTLWNNYELGHGFRGSRLELRAVMYDVLANEYSNDSRVIFQGVCREPGGQLPRHDGKVLSIGYGSRLNLADVQLPSIKVQKTCPWVFPETEQERQAGADDAGSMFYRCGYSPDASGSNARGNLNSGVPFQTCGYTAAHCVARGMFSRDGANRVTGRFGGIQWNPPGHTQTVRNYVSGKTLEVTAESNEARYGDFIPMLWGRAWTDPLVINTLPDGNFVRIVALVCFGEVDAIFDVVVNDYHIPHTFDDAESPISTGPGVPNATEAAKGGWWKCINRGDRDGAAGPTGEDPYGSYFVLEIVVPHRVSAPGQVPRVMVYCERGSAHPAGQIEDILTNWGGWDAAELDSASFTAANAIDTATISTPLGSVYRYTSSLYIRQRESVAEVLRGLRNARRGLLYANPLGKIVLASERTLADQQPSPVSGSNHNTAIASVTAAGGAANGYAAYRFSEANIIGMPSVTLAQSGNRYTVQFQNTQNRHSQDALQVIDSDDIRRVDQEIPGTFTLRGADNYNQIQRLIATYTARQLRGNPRGDTGGTLLMELQTSFRSVHLNIGDLVLVNFELFGIEDQLFRVQRISPETNFETAYLVLAWHEDDWYTDAWGQGAIPSSVLRFRDSLRRPSYPWRPYAVQPEVNDALYGRTDWTFSLAPNYQLGAGEETIAALVIAGRHPVNVFAAISPPVLPIQGSVATTGGMIHGGRTVYVALAAIDSDGKYSTLSRVCLCAVPPSTNTNTATVPNITWAAGTVGYAVFAGLHASALSFVSTDSGTPSSVTITLVPEAHWGPPDQEFDRARVRVKKVFHGGVWGAQVLACTSNTITIAGGDFAVDEYAGYDLAWVGLLDSQEDQPHVFFRVESNTADTLTLASGAPDPSALGMAIGDVVIMMSRPAFGTDGNGTYIEDPAWQSSFYPGGMEEDGEIGRLVRIIAGTGRGQVCRVNANTATKLYCDFPVQPDSTTRYIVEDPKWEVVEETGSLSNSNVAAGLTMRANVSNFLGETLLVQVVTVDGGDNESVEAFSPVRMIYLFGQGLRWITVTEDYEMTAEDMAVAVDTAAGPVTVTLPPIVPGRNRSRRWIVKKISADVNTVIVVPFGGATIDGNSAEILEEAGDSVMYAGDQ